jgi:hypothetical protein
MLSVSRVLCGLAWVVMAATACGGDDDDDSGPSDGGTGATSGHAGTRSQGGTPSAGSSAGDGGHATGGMHTQAGAPDGGSAGQVGTTDPGAGGSSGAGGDTAGVSGGETAQGGAGGDGNVAGHGVCPALGATFKLGPYACGSCGLEDEIAWSLAFGCDTNEGDGEVFTVSRFQVDTERVEEMYLPHTTIAGPKWFFIAPDCEPDGLAAVTHTNYPDVLSQVLQPGIYTAVTCTLGPVERSHHAVPPPQTNVDCAHATPISPEMGAPGGDAPAYFSFDVTDPYHSVYLYLDANETSGSGSITLTGPKQATNSQDYLLNLPMIFSALPSGQYCAEVTVSSGVGYNITMERHY